MPFIQNLMPLIHISPTHLIFKSTIEYMRPTLDLTNSMINLKLDCMKMCKKYVRVSFLNCKLSTINENGRCSFTSY
jgi:hypothetical protein